MTLGSKGMSGKVLKYLMRQSKSAFLSVDAGFREEEPEGEGSDFRPPVNTVGGIVFFCCEGISS